MRARNSPVGTLEVQAFYSIARLARIANVTRHMMSRVLRANGITMMRAGRALFVPLSEIRERIPAFWDSLCAAEAARRGGAKGVQKRLGPSGASGSSRSSRSSRYREP